MSTSSLSNYNKRNRRRQRVRALLWKYVQSEWLTLACGSVAMVVSSMANQALPRLLGGGTDRPASSSTSLTSRMGLGWVIIGGGLASLLRTTLMARAEGSIVSQLRQDAVAALLLHKDLQWFQTTNVVNTNDNNKSQSDATNDKEPSKDTATDNAHRIQNNNKIDDGTFVRPTPAALLQVLNDDVPTMAAAVTTVAINALRSTSAIAYSIYHMCCLDASLLGIAVAVLPAVGAASMVLRKAVRKTEAAANQSAVAASNFLHERVVNLAMVKTAHRQADEVETYRQFARAHEAAVTRQAWAQGTFMGFTFGAASAALLLVVRQGGKAVSQGRLTPGQLTTFTTYSFLLALGTSGLVGASTKWYRGWQAAERYYYLVSEEDNHNDVEEEKRPLSSNPQSASSPGSTTATANTNSNTVTTNVSQISSIALENVSFTYRSDSTPVLQDVSFTVPRGQVVALVGRNGAGKTSVAHILAGLYAPTAGRVVLSDGTSLDEVDPTVRPHLIQMVPQTTALFDLSIRDNVCYSAPQATLAQIQTALTQANCQALVERKGGLDFCIGPQGQLLSGGERQRLSLARALLADPAVLILDEPAAALDTDGETAVAEAMAACRQQQRALVLITHQAKRLPEVDSIIVLQKGFIVERGTFEELTRKKHSVLRQLYPDLL